MFVGVNLIGLIVRGFKCSPPPVGAPTDRVRESLQDESRRMGRVNTAMTLGGILLAATILLGLFYFWNIWLAVAGLLAMVSRIPDLLWELNRGGDALVKSRPQGPVYVVAAILMWGTPLVVWYSLCRMTH